MLTFTDDVAGPSSHNSIQSVSEMEHNIKGKMLEVVQMVATNLEQALTSDVLSAQCDQALMKLMRGAMEMHDWVFKMFDASGKLSSGILEGTAAALGDYDECLNIISPVTTRNYSQVLPSDVVIRGQYCMLKIDMPEVFRTAAMDYQRGNRSSSYIAHTKTFLRNLVKLAPRADIADMRLGICVPSLCNMDDLGKMKATHAGSFDELITILRCETKEDKELEVEQIIILAVLGVIAFFVLCGTSIDTILRTMASGRVDDVFFKKQNMYIQFLVAFSLGNNFRKLVKLETDDGQLSCVRGIKFLSVCLIIFVSTYTMPIDLHFLKYKSTFNIYRFMDQWWFSVIANSSAGIDTLFFLAGLQITYKMWKKAKAEMTADKKVSVNVIKFLIVWYSRLTASQLLVIALFVMFPLIGSGPLWGDVVIPEVEHCKSTWWMNILFINNFWPSNETCLYHTWFLTSLMHMLIVTPFLLWILSRWNVAGVLLMVALIVGSCIAVAMVTFVNEMPPSLSIYFLSFLNLRWMWDKMFIQVYDHLAPFCIGILTGYLLARDPKIEFRKVTVIIGWSATIAFSLSVLLGLFSYRHGETMEPALSALYAGAHRPAWALGIAWIVFSCTFGYGGAVNELLSWNLFIPFERLSNMMYLLYPLVILFHSGQVREKMYMAHLDQVVYSLAYIFLTCILAAFCYVIFVVPYRFLESMTWRPRGEESRGQRHHTISKVIAIKERITNDFNITMRDSPGHLINDNGIEGIDNSAFSA